jgi:hypothetical protein
LIRRGSDRMNSYIMSWSSKGNLGKSINMQGENSNNIAELCSWIMLC